MQIMATKQAKTIKQIKENQQKNKD